MVNYCANSSCSKPLHYLRDGRIYVFDASLGTTAPGKKRERRLEHYWLCGDCAQTLTLVQDAQGWIHVLPRPATICEPGEISAGDHSRRAS